MAKGFAEENPTLFSFLTTVNDATSGMPLKWEMDEVGALNRNRK